MDSKLRIAIILNGISLFRKAFYKKILPSLSKNHQVKVFETKTKNDGVLLASKAVERGKYDIIFAAGGDGTLHQVVNGVLQAEASAQLPVVGLIPLGSGNDFAKTIGATADAQRILRQLSILQTTTVNVGEVIYTDFTGKTQQRYFINVADIGMGPEVVRRVNDSGRIFGSAFAYYKSIITTFFRYNLVTVTASAAEWSWKGKLRSLAIANGKYYGHGLCIAPDALVDDDMFTAFICGNVSVLDFVIHSEKLKSGKFLKLKEVSYRDLTSINLSSSDLCLIEADGEILGKLPASISLAPRKLTFLK